MFDQSYQTAASMNDNKWEIQIQSKSPNLSSLDKNQNIDGGKLKNKKQRLRGDKYNQ